jgi:putative FmdB family regulatory protein
MPTYEYVCSSCANAWEEVQKISEPALEVCPKCQKPTAKRQISGGNFILKGGGWYADLYSSAKPGGAAKGEKGDDAASPVKTESKEGSAAPAKTTSEGSTSAPAAASSGSSDSKT